MKFTFALSALATVAAAVVSAQSVNVIGAQTQQVAPTVAIRIASRDVLDRATALLNKNAHSADNNAFISRSNVVFLQNDRLAMRRRVMEALLRARDDTDDQQQDTPSLTVAVLAKTVLRALSAPTSDSALMRRASAVVAAASRGADRQQRDVSATTLVQRIADLVDAVGMREVEQEDAMTMQTPRGVKVLVGTKDALRAPAMATTTVAVSVAADEPQYRVAMVYLKDRDTAVDDAQEQWGRWGAGYGLGWRYPLGYWNAGGAGLYGGGCGLGFARGPFYYC